MSEIHIGIIGGTGLEEALGAEKGEQVHPDTPFGKPASPITKVRWHGVNVAILKRHGAGHVLNPSEVPYRANVFALKMLGVTHIIASGATGSLRENIHPGELVIVDQVIDKTYKRANTFYEHAAVHVELAEPFCPVMRNWLIETRRHAGRDKKMSLLDMVKLHEKGTYVCMEGPAFSTRAESHMHRAWGGDLIGMTAMPEARLAREAEMAYALIALPTDYDCWRPHVPAAGGGDLLSEIMGNLKKATSAGIELIRAALSDISILESRPSPAHTALKLGIWSDKSRIDPQEVERLRPLWGRYFA